MAKGVSAAIVDILREVAPMDDQTARNTYAALLANKRILMDVWS